ncbi:MAG: right-handed parallel beta-helix repeat-containing protein [bacterium]|nr:right-handed parallel beta-helix repeat-containing protein [bacterium]
MKRIILCVMLLCAIPALTHSQGAVSIDQVNTLVSNYAIQAGQPARFVFRFDNTTNLRCNVSNGFKVSTPDGAVWDSVTIDSAGINSGGENQFVSYFDIVFAMWGGVIKGGDGINPDTVGMLGAGMPTRPNQGMPETFNDTVVALTIWMHDNASIDKHICIDSSFWGAGGTWVWVSSSLIDYFPTYAGLPGQTYSAGSGPDRDGSGFCFAIGDRIVPGADTLRVPSEVSTIQEAVDAINPNGTILVSPGTYTETITITGKKVFLKSVHGALSTTITNADNQHLVTFIGPETNGSLLEGFTLQGGYMGVWCQDAAPTIRRNLLRSQHATSWAAIVLSGVGWGTIGTSPAQIINNTIFGNSGGGISSFSTAAPVIKNNIIANNVKYGIHIQDDMDPQVDPSYNDVFGSPVLYYNVPNPGVGTISADPLFAGDFTLTESSPCINAGDPSPLYNDPDSSRNDMGAFPFDGSVEPPVGDTLRVPAQYTTIQDAINAASNGQVVLVSRGTFYGGFNFNGKLIKVVSTEGPLATLIVPPIVNGQSLLIDLVTFDHGENSQAVIEGFRFEAGRIAVLCLNSGPTIRRNIFKSQKVNNWAAISLAGSWNGVYASEGPAPAIIENNTIMNCENGGISTFSSVAPVIRNNIIYGNHAYGIHKQSSSLPLVMAYNDIFGNPDGDYNVEDYGPGALAAEPRVDNNGILSPNSPCIDAGDPDPSYNDPDGSRNDMGALPYSGIIPPLSDTVYVPTDFPTISAAVQGINSGTILVLPGTYIEAIEFGYRQYIIKSTEGPLVTTLTNDNQHDLMVLSGASGCVIEGFTFDGGRAGIRCANSNPLIRNNIFKNQTYTDWAAIILSGWGYGQTGTSGATIINNTIVNSSGGGISSFSTDAPIIRNNIIANNAKYGIHIDGGGPNDVSYNDVYGNQVAYYNVADPGPGHLAVDPMFNPNYTLAPGSPCINAGDPDSIYNDPDGSRNDMGAVPFGGGQPNELFNLVQWRAADGGNDHWYAVIPQKLYWVEADLKAKTYSAGGYSGHLATISTNLENEFITDHVLIGANQNNRFDNFFIGGRDINGAWSWITGEPWGYTNWSNGEPNNNGIETALCMYGHYDTYSYATPGTWNNSLPDGTVNQLHQYWSVVEFGPNDTVVVDEPIATNEWISVFCASPHLDGQTIPGGSIIRAFDPQGVLCGKATVRADGSFGFMLVYRDDQYTATDEGAIPGDKISFTINGEMVVVSPAIYWTTNGDQFQGCSFERKACITLHLQEGWNLVSWNVGWSGMPRQLLAPIVGCVEFVLAFDNGGLVYDPQLERFSTLTRVDYMHGYWIKMNCAADLEICGEPLDNIPGIPVDRGWNLVSYLPSYNLEPYTAFFTVGDFLEVAIGYDNGAKVYMPSNPGFSTLTTLEPGFGYWIRLSEEGILAYGLIPADNDESHQPLAQSNGEAEPFGSRVWMSLYGDGLRLNGQPLANNSTIEVFTPEGELVGSGVYLNGVLKFMPVYGFDGDNASARLAVLDDQLTLKVNGIEVVEQIRWTGNGTSVQLGALTTSGLPTTFALEQNYPNPFNPATTIAFAVPKHQHVRLVVFNLLGQEIRTLTDQVYDAGRYEVVWDGRDTGGDQVPTGLYFYRFESSDISMTKKMLLLK